MKRILGVIFSFVLLLACDSVVNTTKQVTSADSVQLVGNDKGEHGCIASAGYVWSELKGDCIRVWEVGVSLLPISDSTVSAYAVFNSDSSKVELFLPGENKHEILDRRKLSDGGTVWNVEDDDTKNLRKVDGRWRILQRNKVIYQQK